MDNIIFLDVETTGLGETDEIIEIGAVKLANGKIESYQQLINPLAVRISPRILKLCQGITETELRQSPRFMDIKQQFLDFIGSYPLICHNAQFEKMMLENALGEKLKNTMLDSLELFVLFKPHFPRHGMDYLVQHYLGKDRSEAHRALVDAQDTMSLVQKLFDNLAQQDADLLARSLTILANTDWGWLPYLHKIAPTPLHQIKLNVPNEEETETECAYTLDDINNLLTDEKIWQEYFPGYRVRPQQIEMALAVMESFKEDQALFVEAPTGSGKTLAYLLVSLIWALQEQERVFISTNTKNLQQQVMGEIPRLARMLDITGLYFTEMKGIANYICRRRVDEEVAVPGNDLKLQISRAFLANWVSRSNTGELEDISYWFSVNNLYLKYTVNSLRCYREDCPERECNFYHECFYYRKVRAMKRSHVCTINHSLLLTWPGNYPQINRLICDEAHSLEEKAFVAFTREVSSYDIDHMLDRLARGKDKGFLNYLRFYSRRLMLKKDIKVLLILLKQVKNYEDDILVLLNHSSSSNGGNRMRSVIPGDSEELEAVVLNLSSALDSLATSINEILQEICSRDKDFNNSLLFRQGEEYRHTLKAWASLLIDCFRKSEDESCYYIEHNNVFWAFRITPLDVSEPFFQKIISKNNSIVMTSATLAERGGYGRVVKALGFSRLSQERLLLKDPLPNVYDYGQNSVLIIPNDSPGYKSIEFTDYTATAVFEISKLLRGRTMVLFSSLERMERVIERVRLPLEKEGISVLGGRFSSKRSDLEHFREDLNAVIFGSRGYFEGVDIKGAALSCIIIDKLSFPYQDDPLLKARSEYLSRRGRNPFIDISLAEAIRTIRQQFGRLIRSETDKGFVFVLDQLNSDIWYCQHIINMLPGPLTVRNLTLDMVKDKMQDVIDQWELINNRKQS